MVRAYLLQTHEMLFDAHWHGFVRGVLEPVADRPLGALLYGGLIALHPYLFGVSPLP